MTSGARRAYRYQWGSFERWSGARRFLALPASPATVVLYLAELAEAGRKVASIELALAAIAAAHGAAGLASPRADARVRMVVRGIRRTKGMAQRQATPLLAVDVRAVASRLPTATAQGARDRVLVLLGWAGAFRRSELVGLDVGDVRFVDQGLEVTVRRSKVDQEAHGCVVAVPYAGGPSVCPVRSVRRWLEVASLEAGPLLRAVDRHRRVGPGRLDGGSVARVLKRLAQAAGFEAGAVAGHTQPASWVRDDGGPARSLGAGDCRSHWSPRRDDAAEVHPLG